MQSIAPTRRLNRRSRDFLMGAALVFLLGAAIAVLGIALHIFSVVVPFNEGYSVYDLTRKALLSLGIGVQFAAMLMALRAVTWKTDNSLARGVGEQLSSQLDQQFVFIRNISKRGIGYIDAALVSKHGILVLRINKRKGAFFNEGGHWLGRRRQGGWRPLRWNPTREVVADAMKLKEYLADFELQRAPVYAAVVFTREAPDALFQVQNPAVPVVYASGLIAGLSDSYFAETRLGGNSVQEVVNLLYR